MAIQEELKTIELDPWNWHNILDTTKVIIILDKWLELSLDFQMYSQQLCKPTIMSP